ncbi:Invertase [Elasticomyces elasticus]|nr:Invertase [Elasticomyces elasticus]KAK4990695.1 Invertase [Elasticomyces elasticus]
MISALLPALLLVQCACGQSSTYVEPGVPTGTPIPGNYTGSLRPQVHFSPPQQFMNDPNGMFVDANGTWHLYYQYNPTGTVAGNQHWGHATSRDLYHWENQKIAIFPDSSTSYIYSGSAVVDVNNTSGFFPDQDNGVVAMYTLAYYTTEPGLQVQEIAYSKDGGYTFEKYSGNPVIDINSTQFRDPKILWHAETQHWVVVVAYAADFVIGIYTSPNLRDWTHASNFSHHGLLGRQYECPNLVQMPMQGGDPMYMLWISINPGAPLGGSITQYFPGTFNGTHFEAVDQVARIADFGKGSVSLTEYSGSFAWLTSDADNYAGQLFYGIPGDQKQVSMAWASNWQYCQLVPTGPQEGWRSSMSLPRYNYLTNLTGSGYDLVSAPFNIASQFTQELAFNTSLGNSTILLDYSSLPSGAVYFEANLTGLTASTLAGSVNFTFTSSISGESVRGGTFIGGDTWIDRSRTYGFDNPFFTDKFSVSPVYGGKGTWTISGVVDRSILEVFVNGGEQSATTTFFPTRPLDQMSIGAVGIAQNVTVSVAVWGLGDAWANYENMNGTVLGNVTASF